MWAYIGGVTKAIGLKLYQVGGANDHVHIFFGLPANHNLADAVKRIQGQSSAWMRQRPDMGRFDWQQGYGAFSVSISHSKATIAYIRKQKEHHAKRDFETEFTEITRRHGLVPTGLGKWEEG